MGSREPLVMTRPFVITASREMQERWPLAPQARFAVSSPAVHFECSACGHEHGPYTFAAARAMVADMAKALGGSVTWGESEVSE